MCYFLAGTPVLRWNKIGITVAGVGGSSGNGNNQLYLPVDVLLDRFNNLYVSDFSNHRIQKYMFNSQVGQTIAGNGTAGLSPSQLKNPTYILLDDNENLYIADANNYRIQYWTKDAANGTTVAGVSGMSQNQKRHLVSPTRTIRLFIYSMKFCQVLLEIPATNWELSMVSLVIQHQAHSTWQITYTIGLCPMY